MVGLSKQQAPTMMARWLLMTMWLLLLLLVMSAGVADSDNESWCYYALPMSLKRMG